MLEQNGHAERKRGVFITKVQTMCIAVNIFLDMWPEVIQAVGYIINWISIVKHIWKTLFKKVKGYAPNLSHLKPWGCKAYA